MGADRGCPSPTCSRLSCRYHLGRDITPWGKVRLRRATGPSCALAVAATGPRTYREVGRLLGLSREAVRLVELRALMRLRAELAARTA